LSELSFRPAGPDDAPRLQAIRAAAFAPIFASFRQLLGDAIYDLAQRREDEGQAGLLDGLIAGQPGWSLWLAEVGGEIVGFVAVGSDASTLVGEIGLNAVDPKRAGHGIGTAMYEFAVGEMRRAGMRVATVATGADASHAAARAAYLRAGFDAVVPSVWMCRKL
jgi:GNAT superfamily N-acetyltransferase